MSNKHKLITFLVIVIFISFISYSYSFIVKKITTENILTFGSIKMKLIETEVLEGTEKIIDDKHTIDITSNSKINRNIYCENVGRNSMYVRVKFDVSLVSYIYPVDDYIKIIQSDQDWIYKDGWYYYKESVSPNKKSNKLSININFDIDKITKNLDEKKIDINIIAQAVQSQNNGDNVLNAIGWSSN